MCARQLNKHFAGNIKKILLRLNRTASAAVLIQSAIVRKQFSIPYDEMQNVNLSCICYAKAISRFTSVPFYCSDFFQIPADCRRLTSQRPTRPNSTALSRRRPELEISLLLINNLQL